MATPMKQMEAKHRSAKGQASPLRFDERPDMRTVQLTSEERLRIHDERVILDLDTDILAFFKRVAKVTGEDVATIVLRAMGEGIAGHLRQDFGLRVWCSEVPGKALSMKGRKVTLDVAAYAVALAERVVQHMNSWTPDEPPMPWTETATESIWHGIVTFEWDFFGERDYGSGGPGLITCDVLYPPDPRKEAQTKQAGRRGR